MIIGPIILVLLAVVCATHCKFLIEGTSDNNTLVWQRLLKTAPRPFKITVRDVFYSDPRELLIRGIIARDLDHSNADAAITFGGIGFPYVEIQLRSQRGYRLFYHIEIYVNLNDDD